MEEQFVVFLSVWSDSGTDLQDSISKEKIMEMAYLCKICAVGSVCRYHAGYDGQ